MLYSYLKNKNTIINKILLGQYHGNALFFRNVTYIYNFNYLEFKLWLEGQHAWLNFEESGIYANSITNFTFFQIETIYEHKIDKYTRPISLDIKNFKSQILEELESLENYNK